MLPSHGGVGDWQRIVVLPSKLTEYQGTANLYFNLAIIIHVSVVHKHNTYPRTDLLILPNNN